MSVFPHVCSCGKTYTQEEWEALKLDGYQDDPPLKLELRTCPSCNSTRAVLVDGPGNYVETHPDDKPCTHGSIYICNRCAPYRKL